VDTDRGEGFGSPPLVELRSITKHYGPTRAVEEVDLTLARGEIHALLGENGAGKSTIAKIISGIIPPSGGTVAVDGEMVEFSSVREAEALGVVLIPQELNLFGPLSVAENVFVGRRRPRSMFGVVEGRRMRRVASDLLDSLSNAIDPRTPVERLSPASKQLVAIARALVLEARVMVMDEPTAALDEWEAQRLLSVIGQLKESGVGILYVSHRLSEIRQAADIVTILRDGRLVAAGGVGEFDDASIVRHMVGRTLASTGRRSSHALPEVALRVTHLTRAGSFEDITFELRRGEVVGLAGLVGAGRSELGRALFGERLADSGTIEVDGNPVHIRSVADAVSRGIGYVPEERQSQGLLLPFTGIANISLPVLDRYVERGFINTRRERREVRQGIQPFSVRGDVGAPVDRLSGGNQQKVLLAKWLMAGPDVLILDEPTRGVDVGVRADIYRIVDELAAAGKAILVISSDNDEILTLSDRVLVMREGRLVAEIDGAEADHINVGEAVVGHLEEASG
jgi:ABC-type sugar transport system ATPase subunit